MPSPRWCASVLPRRMQRWTARCSGCRTRCIAGNRSFVMRARTHALGFVTAICLVLGALLSHAQAQERVVNFYNWSNYMAPGVLEDFTKQTGIKVVYDTFDANETLETRLLAG